ncbi:hypothetical protein BSL78_02396 [Apostichopus japonicus]|uniref:RRM domain-containing protein n=1 Tax=Stichopus japonicus TaxID=307972 RepID=A0A2G8LKD3_STIJA|nr:hypothetical protein BSL78_02396 [Apostichopus japonicus]
MKGWDIYPYCEEVRTLFVSGLPMDAKPRELYLLFRGCKGYEGSLLKVTSKPGKSQSPVGFVTFDSRAGAEAAKESLQVRRRSNVTVYNALLTNL